VSDRRECAVAPHGLARVEVDRRLDQEDADEAKHDHPREVSETADRRSIHFRIVGLTCSLFES
jgi:hypothetical protein